jgi:hypothetical protein
MFKAISCVVSLASVLTTGPSRFASAADEWRQLPSVDDLSTRPEVFLVSDQRKKDCARIGTVCLFGNGGSTIAGIDVNPTVGIVTTLARGTQVAAIGGNHQGPADDAEDTWRVEMIARFRSRTTLGEPIIVAVMDYGDPDGMAKKEATAVWQVDGARAKDLGLRFAFSTEDGFLPRHTYLVRLIQGVGVNEKVLAEGSFLLE